MCIQLTVDVGVEMIYDLLQTRTFGEGWCSNKLTVRAIPSTNFCFEYYSKNTVIKVALWLHTVSLGCMMLRQFTGSRRSKIVLVYHRDPGTLKHRR